MFAAHPGNVLGLDAAEISYVAAAVRFSIRVDELTIEAGLGNAQAVVVTHHGRCVHHECDDVAVARFSQERDDAVIGVVKIDPIKSFVGIVELPERWLVFVNVIQMLHQPAQAIVPRQLKQLPIEIDVVVPFVPLAEFAAHEQQLFAGLPVHPRQKHPEIGELLPFVARHLGKERTLAVNDFVVAQHQNEMFAGMRRAVRK